MSSYTCMHCKEGFRYSATEDEMVFCPHCNALVALPEEDEVGPGDTLGGYEILELIGKGGMGNVYLANQLALERKVALKVLPHTLTLNKDAVEQFFKEVRISGSLTHPNIVVTLDAGEVDGTYYLAMTYVDGETLEDTLDNSGEILEKTALRYILDIAQALQYAWEQHGLFHKDIKPGNIMVNSAGEAFLMDMGIAQRIQDPQEKKSHIEGSPFYMSPEQTKAKPLDWSTDLYSLGATLYNLIVGMPPYDAPEIMEILEMHSESPYPEPYERNPGSSVSPEVSAMMKKMMAKTPEERYSSWEAYIKSLKKLIKDYGKKKDTKTQSFKKPPQKTPVPRTKKRKSSLHAKPKGKPVFMIVNTVLMLIVGLAIAYFMMKANNESAAKNALASAKTYANKENPKPEIALENFKIARSKASELFVPPELLKQAEDGVSKWGKKFEETEKIRKKFEELITPSRNLYIEAKDLMTEAELDANEDKDSKEKFREALSKAEDALDQFPEKDELNKTQKEDLLVLEVNIKFLINNIKKALKK